MKKIMLLALASMLTVCSSAQKIVWDKTESDGFRSIATSKTICSSGEKKDVSISLDASTFPEMKDTSLYLSFYVQTYSECSVPKGGKLLVKLFDDSVIELSTPISYEDNIGSFYSGYVVRTFRIYPRYKVSEEQVDKIISFGVKKLRMELFPSNYDKEFTEDKIGKSFSVTYPLIKKALNEKKTFSDGF